MAFSVLVWRVQHLRAMKDGRAVPTKVRPWPCSRPLWALALLCFLGPVTLFAAPVKSVARPFDPSCVNLLTGADGSPVLDQAGVLYEVFPRKNLLDNVTVLMLRRTDTRWPYTNPELASWEEPLNVDRLTGLLAGGVESSRRLLDFLIDKAQRESRSTAFLFLDVNDLNLSNDFDDYHASGDRYLRQISMVSRKVLDSVNFSEGQVWKFRIGGDEALYMIRDVTPDKVFQIQLEIRRQIANDPALTDLFLKELRIRREALEQELGGLTAIRAAAIRALVNAPNAVAGSLTVKDYLHQFENLGFKLSDRMWATLRYFETIRRFRPSVTLSAVMIAPGDDYARLAALASKDIAATKASFKKFMGLTMTEKQGSSSVRRRVQYNDEVVPVEPRRVLGHHRVYGPAVRSPIVRLKTPPASAH
jgi:GGDEF domain-containing protein